MTEPETPATPKVGPCATPDELAVTWYPMPAKGVGNSQLAPPDADHPPRMASALLGQGVLVNDPPKSSGPKEAFLPTDAPPPNPTQRLRVWGLYATVPAGPPPAIAGTGANGTIQLKTHGLLSKLFAKPLIPGFPPAAAPPSGLSVPAGSAWSVGRPPSDHGSSVPVNAAGVRSSAPLSPTIGTMNGSVGVPLPVLMGNGRKGGASQ